MTAVLTEVSTAGSQRATASRRRALVIGCLVLGIVVLFATATMVGSVMLTPADVIGGILGTAEPSTVFVVRELRLPRALAAVLIGLALGASGTLFQRVLGNPLASPDFLGVAEGAGTATVAALVFGAAGVALPVCALLGGALTAAVIGFVAWNRGLTAYRFILVGIGVSAFATSVTSYLLARAEFRDARAAITWLVGSVGMASPESLTLLAVVLVLFIPAGLFAARALNTLELGDDSARTLGARVQGERLAVIAIAVVLVSVATAAAGPIAFVAMLAGPLVAIPLGSAGRSILAAALMGVVIIQIADLLAQHALPWPVSTGVVTGVFGAPYIAWVLISSARKAGAQ
ncbi:MAG: iron chelate uptake ABC transporter family permease subunit [Microbacterium sp.]